MNIISFIKSHLPLSDWAAQINWLNIAYDLAWNRTFDYFITSLTLRWIFGFPNLLRRHNQPSKTGGRPIFRTTQPVFWPGFDPLSDILQRPPCSRACLDILPVFAVSLPTIIYSNLNKVLQISGDPSAPQPVSGGQWTVNQKLESCEHSPVVHWWPAIFL